MSDIGVHFDPPAELADVVKHFYCIQTCPDSGPALQQLSPSLEIMLIFNFGRPVPARIGDTPIGDSQIEKVALIGPLRKILRYTVLAETDLLVLTFNADGFYRLFDIPVSELDPELMHDPDELLGILSFEQLWRSMGRLNSSPERIQLLARHLAAFLNPKKDGFSLSDSNQSFEIAMPKQVAIDTHLSQRAMQMRFKNMLVFQAKSTPATPASSK